MQKTLTPTGFEPLTSRSISTCPLFKNSSQRSKTEVNVRKQNSNFKSRLQLKKLVEYQYSSSSQKKYLPGLTCRCLRCVKLEHWSFAATAKSITRNNRSNCSSSHSFRVFGSITSGTSGDVCFVLSKTCITVPLTRLQTKL